MNSIPDTENVRNGTKCSVVEVGMKNEGSVFLVKTDPNALLKIIGAVNVADWFASIIGEVIGQRKLRVDDFK